MSGTTPATKTRPDNAERVASMIVAMLAAIRVRNLSGPFAIEGNANCGGVLLDSLKLIEKKRIA